MGYSLQETQLNQLLHHWQQDYVVYAPRRFEGQGTFSDTSSIRYDVITDVSQMEYAEKSHYSFKEAILPLCQTMFYFTEEAMTEPAAERAKPPLLFLRSCDVHALRRLDEIYLRNKFADPYYQRLRENLRLVVLSCETSCENGFCVSMGTNVASAYNAWIHMENQNGVLQAQLVSQWGDLDNWLAAQNLPKMDITSFFVKENKVCVTLPKDCNEKTATAALWKDYDSRCIACGRCNFVCPTCTCYTMQDIFYQDNPRVGERRRVHASCMVDGFTNVAGGGCYRKTNGERMRFKVLHKISDFQKQFGYQMCVGCGRCDDACPEYISFSACVNKLAALDEGGIIA